MRNDFDSLSQLTARVFSLTQSEMDPERLIPKIVVAIQESLDIDSIGIRIRKGYDFPYYFTRGFDPHFIEMEMSLCAVDSEGETIRDSAGDPYLECMCGNVIGKRADPSLPFFTEGGSFWSNCTTELLATTTVEQRQNPARNRCNSEGYESVALIPIPRIDEKWNMGLLQLNDRRPDRFDLFLIEYLEGLATYIGQVILLLEAKNQVLGRVHDLDRIVDMRNALLKRISSELSTNAIDDPQNLKHPQVLERLNELINELERISGFVVMCCQCKSVRIGRDSWATVEQFIIERSTATFSHTYCPRCAAAMMKNLEDQQNSRGTRYPDINLGFGRSP